MSERHRVNRREFVKITGATGAGLVLGFYLPACTRGDALPRVENDEPGSFMPNAWIRIDTDGVVTIIVDRSEMGQGVATALPMLVAEELEADWKTIQFEFAPADEAYVNPAFRVQGTFGSASVRVAWEPLRQAGAVARTMLIAAAAQRWGVSERRCRAENGSVVDEAGDRRLSFGELAESAATLPVPRNVGLKDPRAFRLIGTRQRRLDTPVKVDGSATFGMDVRLPGMKFAAVAQCPVFGGSVLQYDAARAGAVPGVRRVLRTRNGVAVVADNTWSALQGKRALDIRWDEGANAFQSSAKISNQFRELAGTRGAVVREQGDVPRGLERAARQITAEYELPFLAHATMEPMNCTAHVRSDGCDVWVPTQNQTATRRTAARLARVPMEQVAVHTTYLGGGFGRRYETDFVGDAVEISRTIGAPVQVVWSREDDIQHDFYRPASYHVLRGGLDADGWPSAWSHRLVCPSILARATGGRLRGGLDPEAVEGARHLPYEIPNIAIDYHHAETGVPVGFWRSINHTHNAFVKECFVDELARAGGKDPVALRLRLLGRRVRHRRVLEAAAEQAGWGSPLPRGRARGIALHEAFMSVVAQVAEVSLVDGAVRVHRVVCALDCGVTVNPAIVEAQVESAIVYGLTAALHGAITIDRGRVTQSNFHDYEMLRMHEMPAVEVHLLRGIRGPAGVGETATPPIAPAVANAVYALTGTPVRRLPLGA